MSENKAVNFNENLAVKHWAYEPRFFLLAVIISFIFHLLLGNFWQKYSQLNKFASVNISAKLTTLPKKTEISNNSEKQLDDNNKSVENSKLKQKIKNSSQENKTNKANSAELVSAKTDFTKKNLLTKELETASSIPLKTSDQQIIEQSNEQKLESAKENKRNEQSNPANELAKQTTQSIPFPKKGRLHFSIYYGEYLGKNEKQDNVFANTETNSTPSNTLLGKAMHEWEINDNKYRIHTVADTAGMVAIFKSYRIEQESKGTINQQGFIPTSLKTFRNNKETDEKADFDWNAKQVQLGRGEDKIKELTPGTQDLVSFAYQLVFLDISKNQQFMVATGKKYELYQFRYIGEEMINIPLIQTKAKHLRTERGNTSLDVWLARDYLPVPLRIKITDKDGRIADQVLERVEIE